MTKARPIDQKKKCGRCGKTMRLDAFAINSKTGSLYSYCDPCRVTSKRNKAQPKKSRLAVQDAALRSGEELVTYLCLGCGPRPIESFGVNKRTGRPHQRCKKCHAKMMQRSTRYQKSESGKDSMKRYSRSEKGRVRDLRYESSGKGKATRARYKQKEAAERRLLKGVDSMLKQLACEQSLESIVCGFD